MPDNPSEPVARIDLGQTNPLHQAVGEAIEAYAMVEANLASLLEALLGVSMIQAHAVLFAIQNIRSRNEMFQTLLAHTHFHKDIKKYWASCSKYLLMLAQFRNAIAHWHPNLNVYVNKDFSAHRLVHALGHPVPGTPIKSLEVTDLAPFLTDCQYIRQELSALTELVKNAPVALPEKFQKPITRRNQAALRQRHSAKEQQPQRPPSLGTGLHRGRKPSARQRRERALSRVKKRPSG
jgi:hypothetical protein